MRTHFNKIFGDFVSAFLMIAMIFLATVGILATCNHQPTQHQDDVMQDMDWECGESDEFKMWIGGDGDTIWE